MNGKFKEYKRIIIEKPEPLQVSNSSFGLTELKDVIKTLTDRIEHLEQIVKRLEKK